MTNNREQGNKGCTVVTCGVTSIIVDENGETTNIDLVIKAIKRFFSREGRRPRVHRGTRLENQTSSSV